MTTGRLISLLNEKSHISLDECIQNATKDIAKFWEEGRPVREQVRNGHKNDATECTSERSISIGKGFIDGLFAEDMPREQVRLFGQNASSAFNMIRALFKRQ